jgi:hypothetical protein
MNQREVRNRTLVWAVTYVKDKRASWDPFSALKMYQSQISSRLSTNLQFSTTQNIQDAIAQANAIKPDVLFICPSWRVGCEETKHLLQALRETGIKRTVFIDACDGTATPFLPLLADVDLYLKPHLLRDTRLYLHEYAGGYIFTDFLVRCLGWKLNNWHFGSFAKQEQLDKLRVGWSYGVSRRNHALATLSSFLRLPWALRHTAVNRRFRPVERGAQEWYEQYRSMASKSVEQLGSQVKISGYDRISYKRYLLELMTTKFAFSPFGWGEVCIRDYETVACGALLIKPDMSHVRTEPDIFIANETYVPIKWDFSDLAEKVAYYISHPDEAKRIAITGQRRLLKYFRKNQFLKDFRGYLHASNACGPPLPPPTKR